MEDLELRIDYATAQYEENKRLECWALASAWAAEVWYLKSLR